MHLRVAGRGVGVGSRCMCGGSPATGVGGVQPIPALREGPRYQAMIPAFASAQPPGQEDDDKRRGRRVDSADVLNAATIEKIKADQLPFDAVADAEFHRSDGGLMVPAVDGPSGASLGHTSC